MDHVQLKNPQPGEENIVYRVVNYNESTRRCYIEPCNLTLNPVPQELVSVDDIQPIKPQS